VAVLVVVTARVRPVDVGGRIVTWSARATAAALVAASLLLVVDGIFAV
jgi:hypothetical protein